MSKRTGVAVAGKTAEAVAEAKRARWLEENSAALDAANSFVEKRGIPLARHRKF